MRDCNGAETNLTVGVVGVGAIGATLARGYDRLGYDIVINDVDPARVARLDYESKAKDWLRDNADLVIVAVPTPTKASGGDASIVDEVLADLAGGQAVICLRSTMPPGATEELADKHDEPLVYTPEFLRDRSTVEDFFNPDRIVLSGPDEQRRFVRRTLEDDAIDCETFIESRDYLSVEIGKEAHNAFFATKVSFANQIRLICERVEADPELVMKIVTADSRNTTSHLDPMLGPYGGKCLPKDTRALMLFAEMQRAPTAQLEGTIRTNDIARNQYEHVDIEGTYPDIEATGSD